MVEERTHSFKELINAKQILLNGEKLISMSRQGKARATSNWMTITTIFGSFFLTMTKIPHILLPKMKLHDAMSNYYLKFSRKLTTFIKNLEIDLQMYHSHIDKLMNSEYSKYSNWYWGLIWSDLKSWNLLLVLFWKLFNIPDSWCGFCLPIVLDIKNERALKFPSHKRKCRCGFSRYIALIILAWGTC